MKLALNTVNSKLEISFLKDIFQIEYSFKYFHDTHVTEILLKVERLDNSII
jgi:hypothetical protein